MVDHGSGLQLFDTMVRTGRNQQELPKTLGGSRRKRLFFTNLDRRWGGGACQQGASLGTGGWVLPV
jgi:hypothetical protein